MSNLLTKSKFKIALECPTKLYYTQHPKEYENSKMDDPFLLALAKGGFQVGELAKCYYPNGVEIKGLDYKNSVENTTNLLKQENVVIFEAAIKFKNLFIRVDILEKQGNVLNLIEVKSKSCDPSEFESELWNSRELKKGIHSLKVDWKSYLYDLAFQSYVLKKAFPHFEINNFLMVADRSKIATVDGLNQKFILVEQNGRTSAQINGDVSLSALGEEILVKIPLNEVMDIIHQEKEMSERFEGKGFEGAIWYFSDSLENDLKIPSVVGKKCKGCEFRTKSNEKKSGFDECWKMAKGLSPDELLKPFVFDVWNFKGAEKALDEGHVFMEDLDATFFKTEKKEGQEGLSSGERQLLQVEKIKDNDLKPYFDLGGLSEEMDTWKYPLHMIDFETCMVAIPFNKGQRPYEQIAFQFSHHMIYSDGKIEHADEYINFTPGKHPNFEFLRYLKKALEKDNGSIFRYSNHENTVLCQIRDQLMNSKEDDKEELISFVETITTKKDDKKIIWKGQRTMIDLCELVKKYYYSPLTKGSNPLKYVLPAILNESNYIKDKYSKPIYGAEIKSTNFKNQTWIKIDANGNIENPYHELPPIFSKWDFEKLDLVMSDTDIQNGGAALTAYSMMQFTHMSDVERDKIKAALLRYCELDTLAMVMIWEHWNDLIKIKKLKAA